MQVYHVLSYAEARVVLRLQTKLCQLPLTTPALHAGLYVVPSASHNCLPI